MPEITYQNSYDNFLNKNTLASLNDGTITNVNNNAVTDGAIQLDQTTIGVIRGTEDIKSGNYSEGVQGWRIKGTGDAEFNNGTFRGSLSAGTIDIGGSDSTSFHVDSSGNTWSGSGTIGTAPFKVTSDGALTATSATITGALTTGAASSIGTTYLSGTIQQTNLNIADRGWTQTCAFSVTDADTVSWGSGTFTSADGTAYSISAGNTGNMAAKTYIYLNVAVSTTVYQTTTTSSTALGVGKVLIAIAQNGTTEATFSVLQGQGGQNIDAANIVAGSITANEIAASTITSGKMNVTDLSSISANLGSITSGSISVVTGPDTVAITPSSTNAIVSGPTGSPTFTVTKAGALTSTSATVGGWKVDSSSIKDAAGTVGLSSTVTGGDDIRFFAGNVTPSSAPFRVTEAGSLTATSGSIGGFTLGASEMYGGVIKTGATVGVGSNGVIMDTAGVRGYSSTLGKTFDLPTNGSAPTFSSGIINSTIFNVDTANAIRTSDTVGDGTASSAGILINNTGLYGCAASQTPSTANVRILTNGSAYFKNVSIGGYQLFEAVATKEGVAGATLVYYNGNTYNTIKDTIDAAVAGGDTNINVFVRSGTYDEPGNTTASWGSDVNIIGEDRNSVIINLTSIGTWYFDGQCSLTDLSMTSNISTSPMVRSAGKKIVIKNCSITNNYSNASSSSCINVYSTYSSTGSSISDSDIISNSTIATGSGSTNICPIYFTGTHSNITITNNKIKTDRIAVYFSTGTFKNTFITQNNIELYQNPTYSGTTNGACGVHINSTSFYYSSISNNNIFVSNETNYFYRGVYINCGTSSFFSNKISNNFIKYSTLGIQCYSGGSVISGNEIVYVNGEAIYVIGGDVSTSGDMGTIVSQNILSDSIYGIKVSGSMITIDSNSIRKCEVGVYSLNVPVTNVVIANNLIKQVTTYGVHLRSNTSSSSNILTDIIISNNVFFGISGSAGFAGVFINGYTSKNVSIATNTFSYFQRTVILLSYNLSSINFNVVNNLLIYAGGSTYPMIDIRDIVTGCSIINNKNYEGLGIACLASNDWHIRGNLVSCLLAQGQMTGCEITDNVFYGSDIETNTIYVGGSAYNNIISNNQIYTSYNKRNILISGDADRLTLSGNQIGTYSVGNYEALYVTGNMLNSVINGNQFKTAYGYEHIVISGNINQNTSYQGVIISNNIFLREGTQSTSRCMYVGGFSYGLSLVGNFFLAYTDYSVYIAGASQYLICSANRFSGSTADGLGGSVRASSHTSDTYSGNVVY